MGFFSTNNLPLLAGKRERDFEPWGNLAHDDDPMNDRVIKFP
jgi:hypothetical protein